MPGHVTGHPLFDGTFSVEAVAAAAHALVQRLHDDAMATIAVLADHWDRPVESSPVVERDEPVTYRDPATWSVQDDEDDLYPDDVDEGGPYDRSGVAGGDDEVRVLRLPELPALLPRTRRTGTAATAAGDRRFAAV